MMGVCCVGSAAFLGGTIIWVRKMTFSRNKNELKAGSLDLKTVFGHMALLLI
jgi:hypothetical protein